MHLLIPINSKCQVILRGLVIQCHTIIEIGECVLFYDWKGLTKRKVIKSLVI